MKRFTAALILAVASLAMAHDDHPGKPITIVGQVIDTGCYLTHDSKGDSHATCAAACAKAGVPLAILDDSGKVYMPIAMDHKNQNLKLMPFIEKRVKVAGTAVTKGGVNGIAIKTVEAAQ